MTEVSLSEVPDAGNDLEDYVAALFQSAGYFVQKGIIERDPSDVLELDIVASRFSSHSVRRVVTEVKGGYKWGFSDLFKVVGWLTYLGIPEGAFFVKTPDDQFEAMKSKISSVGVNLVHIDDFANAKTIFETAGYGAPYSEHLIELWRFSYAVERRLIESVMQRSKNDPSSDGAAEAKRYYRQINDGTFFSQTPEEAAALLYKAYAEHPVFTAANGSELDGTGYTQTAARGPSLLNATRHGMHSYLQACMYIEHLARLTILKTAVDCLLKNGTQVYDNPCYSNLPQTFKHGLQWLASQPTFWNYATLWQQLLWGWGGFVLTDRLKAEYSWMSSYSGVPADEIPSALEAFDRFFPLPQASWFRVIGHTAAKQLILMPWPFKGLGAHHRKEQYGLTDFSGLSNVGFTEKDLVSWNNGTVKFLQ